MSQTEFDLSEAERAGFDGFSASPAMADHAMDASTLQGLATALAIGPRLVAPSLWLPWVWDMHHGQRPPAFASMDEANAMLALVLRQHAAAVAAFEREPVDFEPLFRPELQSGAAGFCTGFMIGVRLALADWAPLEAADPDALTSLRTLADAGALRRFDADQVGELIEDIVPSLHYLHGFWQVGVGRDEAPQLDPWQRVRLGLKWLQRPFPAATVALAEAHRDAVAPQLVQVLSALARDPTPALDDDYTLHLFAMHLLAGWRDRRAFAPLLALGQQHDPEVVDKLFGELVHDSYGRCLASVSGGELAPMMALADDAQADVWVRSAVLGGLTACVLEGEADRESVVAYLRCAAEREASALRSGRPPGARAFDLMDSIVAQLTDLCAAESLPAIREWFAEGLLDPGYADLKFVEQNIVEPPDQARVRLRAQKYGYVADAASEMSWWHMFDPTSRWSAPGAMPAPAPVRPIPAEPASVKPIVRAAPKVGRNDPCPCGSGRKYKKCHGAN